MHGYLSRDIICYEKRTVFRERISRTTMSSWGTNNVQGQISEHISAPNGGYRVYYPSNIFHNTSGFDNWGISLRYSLVLAGGIFSHVARLDQSPEGEQKYLMDYNVG